MAHKRWGVVLVSAPGLVQKATASILVSCPEVELLATVGGALSATTVVGETLPDLVLIDATLPDEEVAALLNWVKANAPQVRSVVMTVNSKQRDMLLEYGADVAYHRSSFASLLHDMLDCSALSNGPVPGMQGPDVTN